MNPTVNTHLDSQRPESAIEDDRTGLSVATLRRALADNLFYVQGKFPEIATKNDLYMALAYTVRDRLLQRWINTIETYLKQQKPKIVCYLSAEFLLGPRLGNCLINLGIYDRVRESVEEFGLDLKELLEQEAEPGLGNGGLGRLAACYMDSLATLEIPAIGRGNSLNDFHETFAVQLNDTHPSIGVAELMRLLVDEHQMAWDTAWEITEKTFAYTNHTLLPEALEKWPISLFGSLLPRHLEIIYEINRRFLDQVRLKFGDDLSRIARMSLIDEGGERYVRMANLATVGSHKVNGVAELHSQLLKETTLHDFFELWPEKFLNITNGVTPRRFVVSNNPRLASLVTRRIGDGWIKKLDDLRKLEGLVDDAGFRREYQDAKQANKQDLADYIHAQTGIAVNPDSMFDVQVKRLHEYKRQHLGLLHVITLYNRIKRHRDIEIVPRTFIFGGKAAPGYFMAKLIIKLINSVGEVVNNDPDVGDRLRVVFLPNYNVKQARWIYPAANLSEQISTAGYEASGTSNMKFALNPKASNFLVCPRSHCIRCINPGSRTSSDSAARGETRQEGLSMGTTQKIMLERPRRSRWLGR